MIQLDWILNETKFGIPLVDSMPYEVCYFLVRSSPGGPLVIYSTSVLWLAPETFGEENDLRQLGKMRLAVDATHRNFSRKTYGSVEHHLLSP